MQPSKEWAAQTFQVQFLFWSGTEPPKAGDPATWKVPENQTESRDTVMMWSHAVKDGAGHGSAHFDYICEDDVCVMCIRVCSAVLC